MHACMLACIDSEPAVGDLLLPIDHDGDDEDIPRRWWFPTQRPRQTSATVSLGSSVLSSSGLSRLFAVTELRGVPAV
jgi:hypothetical protein